MAPVVHEYTSEANLAGPVQTRQARTADTGGVGNAITEFGNAMTDATKILAKRAGQAEISKLTANLAKAHADFSNDLDSTLMAADPNDREISSKFMANYDQKMSDVENNITTPEAQDYFARANAQMRSHFQIASMQGQATLAGHAAVQDVKDALGNYSSSLLNDPSAFENVRTTAAMGIQAQVDNGTLDVNTANKIRAQGDEYLAKAAVRGWIQLDPVKAKTDIESGKWDKFVDGDTKYQLTREADQGINAKRVEEQRKQTLADQLLREQQGATQDRFLQKLYNNGLSTEEVLKSNLEAFGSGSKEQFLKMIDSARESKIKTEPGTFIDLFNRVHLPDGDPQKITDENTLNQYLGHGLTLQNIQQLRGEMQGKKSQAGIDEAMLKSNFLKTAASQLTKTNPMLGIRDPEGDTQYQGFISAFIPAYEQAKKEGKKPQDLLNPGSSDYMGNMIRPFIRSPQDIMKSIANPYSAPYQVPTVPTPSASNPNAIHDVAPTVRLAPGSGTPSAAAKPKAEPRRVGESPEDYLKRTKGAR